MLLNHQLMYSHITFLCGSFTVKDSARGFSVDGGITTGDLNTLYSRFFYKLAFASERPITLLLEDAECGVSKAICLGSEKRQSISRLNLQMSQGSDTFSGLVRKSFERRHSRGVAVDVSYSQGEREDLFKMVVTTAVDVPMPKNLSCNYCKYKYGI